jgi:hypothetical protein
VRVQWLALAAALVVLAGTVVAWALSRAAERVQVVSVAQPVPAGDIITLGDLTISEFALDDGVRGLVPAESIANLTGRVATIDLAPGMLLSTGMWADDVELGADERTVGAVLAAGRYPTGLAHGTSAWAIDVRPTAIVTAPDGAADASPAGEAGAATDAGGPSTDAGGPIVVRVLDVEVDQSGELRVTLAVPASSAVDVASLAATDRLALAGIPTSAVQP